VFVYIGILKLSYYSEGNSLLKPLSTAYKNRLTADGTVLLISLWKACFGGIKGELLRDSLPSYFQAGLIREGKKAKVSTLPSHELF